MTFPEVCNSKFLVLLLLHPFFRRSLSSCLPTSTLPPPSSCTICLLPFPSSFYHHLRPVLPTLHLGLSFASYAYLLPTSASPTSSSSSPSSSSSSSSSSSFLRVLPPTLLSFLSYLLTLTSTPSSLTFPSFLSLLLSYLLTPTSFSHPCPLSMYF